MSDSQDEHATKTATKAVEAERRAKQAATQRKGEEPIRQLIASQPTGQNPDDRKAAEIFNTNRTYINEAKKLKETSPEAVEAVEAERRAKQAESLKETHRSAGISESVCGNLLSETKNEHKNTVATKAAEIFNTNRLCGLYVLHTSTRKACTHLVKPF